MKKVLLGLVIVSCVGVTSLPVTAQAATRAELLQQIETLTTLISLLQKQLDLKKQQSNVSGTVNQTQAPEVLFAEKLRSCTAYKTTFTHPFTGEMMEKEVLGMVDGVCGYVEQMPGGGSMECRYSDNDRLAVAQYYEDLATADSSTTTISISFDTGSGESETSYTINGKSVTNPLQEAMDNGTCVISGY